MEIVQGLFSSTMNEWKILAIHFLLNKQWLCNVFEYQWIPGGEPKATLSVTESAVTGGTLLTYGCSGRQAWPWLLWSRWQGHKLCTQSTSIIPLVTPTCCAVGFPSTKKKKRRKTLSKQCWDAGFHQPRTLHVSCSTVARTETHLPEPSQPNSANFFHLSVETIFHFWHLCWLSILSVNWIPDPPPSRFFSHTHWIHKQDWTRSVQGSISCPVVQQIIFLSHISAWGYIADNS